MSAVLCTLCAVGTAMLLRPAVVPLSLRGRSPAGPQRDGRPVLVRLRVVLCGLSVVAGWVVLSDLLGLVVGVAGGVLAWRALGRLESPAVSRRRREVERDLPTAVHLLGACLAAGSPTSSALAAVAAAMPGAVGEEFALVQRRLQLGVDPVSVWRSVDGPLEPLGRSMARAHESGGSVRQAIGRLSEDLRSEPQARAVARARTIEVRAAAPLGLCFLPAFVLLGVVPMAAALFSSLALFG